jgi:L-ribulose-5-phosphate 4-epimerase
MNNVQKLIEINQRLIEEKLVIFTWGNASFRTPYNTIYIKPSGVPFGDLTEEKMSEVALDTKTHLRGNKPSVDTPTHIELYNNFDDVGSIIHTHSKYCTIFAQAKKSIPCLGTTHADYFYGPVPVVDDLSADQIEQNYEENTGIKIVEYFKTNHLDPLQIPAALSPSHGVFVWGPDMNQAIKNAVVLENIAEMAYKTLILCYDRDPSFDCRLLDKHFLRKHGSNKYYGQQ